MQGVVDFSWFFHESFEMLVHCELHIFLPTNSYKQSTLEFTSSDCYITSSSCRSLLFSEKRLVWTPIIFWEFFVEHPQEKFRKLKEEEESLKGEESAKRQKIEELLRIACALGISRHGWAELQGSAWLSKFQSSTSSLPNWSKLGRLKSQRRLRKSWRIVRRKRGSRCAILRRPGSCFTWDRASNSWNLMEYHGLVRFTVRNEQSLYFKPNMQMLS